MDLFGSGHANVALIDGNYSSEKCYSVVQLNIGISFVCIVVLMEDTLISKKLKFVSSCKPKVLPFGLSVFFRPIE